MKPQPPSNGNGPGGEQSDLEAILERVAPDRRADFLRLRQRLQRHDDNDELLAVLGYLDTAIVLMDLTARQAQPEAINRERLANPTWSPQNFLWWTEGMNTPQEMVARRRRTREAVQRLVSEFKA